MVVCLCKGVSDKTIRWMVQNGSCSLRDVMLSTKAGTDCGTCVCEIRDLVEKTRCEELDAPLLDADATGTASSRR